MKNRHTCMKLVLAVMILAIVPLASWAHVGEDHDAPKVALPTATLATRASAQTDDFELVVVTNGKKMTLTLDRFATNEPVADAKIEVDIGGGLNVIAHQITAGVYTLTVPDKVFAKPAKYPLTITVQAGNTSDLLSTTLDLTPLTTIAAASQSESHWLARSALGALLFIVVVALSVIAIRRRLIKPTDK